MEPDIDNEVRRVGRFARERAMRLFAERRLDIARRLDERGADTVRRLGDRLRTRSAEELIHEVESAIRAHPAAAIVACLGAGFVAARLLKA